MPLRCSLEIWNETNNLGLGYTFVYNTYLQVFFCTLGKIFRETRITCSLEDYFFNHREPSNYSSYIVLHALFIFLPFIIPKITWCRLLVRFYLNICLFTKRLPEDLCNLYTLLQRHHFYDAPRATMTVYWKAFFFFFI